MEELLSQIEPEPTVNQSLVEAEPQASVMRQGSLLMRTNCTMGVGRQERVYTCSICAIRCYSKSSLARHVLLHEANPKQSCYKCDLCKLRFVTQAHLARHRSDKHQRIYTCQICRRSYLSMQHLRHHLSKIHGRSMAPAYLQPSKSVLSPMLNPSPPLTLSPMLSAAQCQAQLLAPSLEGYATDMSRDKTVALSLPSNVVISVATSASAVAAAPTSIFPALADGRCNSNPGDEDSNTKNLTFTL